MQRFWPLNEEHRQAKIAQFAKKHGFRLRFYSKGLCAIFDKGPPKQTRKLTNNNAPAPRSFYSVSRDAVIRVYDGTGRRDRTARALTPRLGEKLPMEEQRPCSSGD